MVSKRDHRGRKKRTEDSGPILGTVMRAGKRCVVMKRERKVNRDQFPKNKNPTDAWWDIENCPVPWDLQEEHVYDRIKHSLKERGYVGRLKIRAVFAKTNGAQLTLQTQNKLTKIERRSLNYGNHIIPPDNAADDAIKYEIEDWLPQHPPPRNVMIISSDYRGFKAQLQKLKDLNYNTLAAFRNGEEEFHSVVTDSWFWRQLLVLPYKAGKKKKFIGSLKLEGEDKSEEEDEGEGIMSNDAVSENEEEEDEKWMMTDEVFESLNLSENTLQAIQKKGFQNMTQVQAQTIPQLLNGEDVVCVARTGAGKTSACLIGAVELLVKEGFSNERGIGVIIICHTNEDALKMKPLAEFLLLKHNDDKSVSRKTVGLFINKTRKNSGSNLLITTPERLLSHLQQTDAALMYEELKCVCIDEADKIMLHNRLGNRILKILEHLSMARQTAVFSAIYTSQVKELAKLLKDPFQFGIDEEGDQREKKKKIIGNLKLEGEDKTEEEEDEEEEDEG